MMLGGYKKNKLDSFGSGKPQNDDFVINLAASLLSCLAAFDTDLVSWHLKSYSSSAGASVVSVVAGAPLVASFSLTSLSTSAKISGFCDKNSFALSLP